MVIALVSWHALHLCEEESVSVCDLQPRACITHATLFGTRCRPAQRCCWCWQHLTGHPMRGRCPKLLMLPLNTQLRTNVALLVGSGLVGADLGRVISLAPKALSTRLSVLTQRLAYVREQLGGTMQARHGERACSQSAVLAREAVWHRAGVILRVEMHGLGSCARFECTVGKAKHNT